MMFKLLKTKQNKKIPISNCISTAENPLQKCQNNNNESSIKINDKLPKMDVKSNDMRLKN